MSDISLAQADSGPVLILAGEVTVEHAGMLRDQLLAAIRPGRSLIVDASALIRLDTASVQALTSAARSNHLTCLAGASPAWKAAFARYALPDPCSLTESP